MKSHGSLTGKAKSTNQLYVFSLHIPSHEYPLAS